MWFYIKNATEDKMEKSLHNSYEPMIGKAAPYETEKPVYKAERPAEYEKHEVYGTAVPQEVIQGMEREAYRMPKPIGAPDTAVPPINNSFTSYDQYVPNNANKPSKEMIHPNEPSDLEDAYELMDKNGWWKSE